MEQQPNNLQPAFNPLVDASYKVGKSLQRNRKQPVQPSVYSGLVQKVKQTPQSGGSLAGLGPVTTPYGGSTRYEKFHPGIDFANKIGTPIPSNISGKVTKVVGGQRQGNKGYGNYVEILDTQGNRHRYSHLTNSFVQVGSQINPGQTLGSMGNTGSTYSTSGGDGSHLDYRVWNMYNKYVNPSKFFKA